MTSTSPDKFKHSQVKDYVVAALTIGTLLGGTFLITPNFPIIFGTIASLIKELKAKKIPEKKRL